MSELPLSNRPLVSVCVPTRNRLRFLQQSLQTILAQDYSPLEIVVSDNRSEDGTAEYCQEIATRDPRLRYVRPDQPLGLYANHNFCLRASQGDYVCFFHDDDIYRPSILTRYVSFLQAHPTATIVCSDWDRIDEHGKFVDLRKSRVKVLTPGLEYIEQTLTAGRSSVALSGAMVRRSALGDSPFEESGALGFSDIATWFRIAEQSDVGHIPERLWAYRLHAGAFSQRKIGMVARDYWETFAAYCDDYLRRNLSDGARVARWQSAIRRFRFWALTYEVALHFRSEELAQRGKFPERSGLELVDYRLAPDELQRTLDELRKSGRSLLEHATAYVIDLLIRSGRTRLLGRMSQHANSVRALLGMF